MPRCFIGLGGNLGGVATVFRQAIERLTESDCQIHAVSRCYRTPAVGSHAGADFLNAAVAIDTNLSAEALLERFQSIETELGRVRSVRWGPRTIDLDLLVYGGTVVESPRLMVPHPGCWYRRFVLDPLVDIAAEVIHPIKGATMAELRARLLVRPLPVGLAGGTREERFELAGRLAAKFPEARFFDWETAGPVEQIHPALLFWLGPLSTQTATLTEASTDARFLALPRLPRLGVPATAHSSDEFIRDAVQSALDQPVPVSAE
jgi:2-amino-4-hydroxy-6-hydroxymethyldihydropteridine diphosphokinase